MSEANQTAGMRHGTRYAYRVRGCRCEHCRRWNADYQRSRRRQ